LGWSVNSDRFVLGVDLDGVVADFYGGLRPVAEEWLGEPPESLPPDVTYGLPEWGLERAGGYDGLHRFAVTQRNLFSKLNPMPGAPAVLRRLSARDIRIRIITHRLFIKHFHEQAMTQTIRWLEHHGIPYWDLCFMKDKVAVGADLYLEDSPDNVAKLRAAGLRVICVGNSTNRDVARPRAQSWTEVEEMVIKEHEVWQQSREAAEQAVQPDNARG
jgi:5'(3')-deoxyribonucleotidase